MITKKEIEEIKDHYLRVTSRRKEYMLAEFALKAIEALEKIEDLMPINERMRRKLAREVLEMLGDE